MMQDWPGQPVSQARPQTWPGQPVAAQQVPVRNQRRPRAVPRGPSLPHADAADERMFANAGGGYERDGTPTVTPIPAGDVAPQGYDYPQQDLVQDPAAVQAWGEDAMARYRLEGGAMDPTRLFREPWLAGTPRYVEIPQPENPNEAPAFPGAIERGNGQYEIFDPVSSAFYPATQEQYALYQRNQEEARAERERVRTPGYLAARAQEQDQQARYADHGGAGYANPGFTDQFLAPINDEVAGGVGYVSQAIGNLMRRLQGRDIEVGAADRAAAMRDLAREGQDRYEQENPVLATVGQVLGGALIGPGAGAASSGLLTRLGQAGAVGAAYGVADGEGVGGRVTGGLIGGAAGLATAGVVEGGSAMVRGVSRGVASLANPSPLPRGERQVAGALERALLRDNLSPDELLARLPARADGQLPFEAGGENMAGLAEVVAQSPGRGRTSLLDAIETRQAGVNDRMTSRLGETFGAEGNYFQAIKDRIAQRSAQASQGMDDIGGVVVPLDDASVRALRSGLSSRAVREEALNATADLGDDASAAAARLFGLGDQVLDNPAAAQITVREAQDISYALKEAASRAYRGGFNSRGEALQTLSTAIRQNARTQVPGYDDWLRQFGDASEAIDALRAGQSVFQAATERNSRSAAELQQQWPEWSEAARDNFRRGIGEAIMSRVREQGGVTAMRRLLRSQEFGDRVRIAFPSQSAFDDFMRAAQNEVQMANTANRVVGNSATDRRAAARADLSQQSGVDPLDVVDFVGDMTSPVAATGKGLRLLLKQLPRRDRSILGDEALNGLLGEALTDEGTMQRLLRDLQRARANREVGRSSTSALGLLNIPGVSAAGQNRARGLLTQ